MAMRETVAMDFMGVGQAGSNGRRSPDAAGSSESERVGRLVRPIPNGGHVRRSSETGTSRDSSTTHPFASTSSSLHGLPKQPWSRLHARGRFQPDEDHSGMTVVSPKRERASPDATLHAPRHSPLQSDNSAPASPSHIPAGEFWRMQQQQTPKAQAMYASHQQQQADRVQRTSTLRDEVQRGAQPGPEHNLATPQPPESNKGAFGSPTPFHFQANGATSTAMASPFQNFPFQAGNLPGHAAVARHAGGGNNKQQQPATAQLTIFYAGMVNVYDDVPSDKAQAIMLLAGSGSNNPWTSSNYMNPPASAPGRNNPFPKALMAVPPRSPPSTPGSPLASQQALTTSGHPPRPGVVFSNIRQPPITNVELPQARKASLARFLEKRKDRVRKAPANEDSGDAASASRDNASPGPCTGAGAGADRPVPAVGNSATRSPSPAPAAVQDHHRSSPSPPSRLHPQRDQPSCSTERSSSPPTRPPGTPPRHNMLDSEKRSPTPKRATATTDQTTLQLNANKRARTGRSPRRLPDPDDSPSRYTNKDIRCVPPNSVTYPST